jgi:hypothetical protein
VRRVFLFLPLIALAACGGDDNGPVTRDAVLSTTSTTTTVAPTTTLAPTTSTTTVAPTTTLAPTTSTTTVVEVLQEDSSALDDYGSGRASGIAYGGDAAYGYDSAYGYDAAYGYDSAYGYDAAYGYDSAYGGDCAYGYDSVGDYDCLFGHYYLATESGSVVLAMSVLFTVTLLGGMVTMAWQALRRDEEPAEA